MYRIYWIRQDGRAEEAFASNREHLNDIIADLKSKGIQYGYQKCK